MSTSDASIRPATTSDINEILRMMEEFNRHFGYPHDKEQRFINLSHLLQNASLGIVWIINISDKICGYLVLTYGFSFEYKGKDAFIDELFLKANYRRMGVGNQVLDLICEESSRFGVKAIHLEVEETNSEGLSLYHKMGFAGGNRKLMTKLIA